MTARRTIDSAVVGWVGFPAVVLACVAILVSPRDASAALGPLPIAGVAATAQGAVDIGPGVAVIVCHVGVGAEVLGIPVVIHAGEVAVFLAGNPRDYVGACRSADDDGGSASRGAMSAGIAVPGQTALRAGLLTDLTEGVQVVVCARGDGQLFLSPEATTALVREDAGVTLGSCAASTSGGDGGSGGDSSRNGSSAKQSGAVFVNGLVSVPASNLSCGDRLIVTRVKTTPQLVRAKNTNVRTQFVVVNDQGMLVRGATVWIRSTPLGYVLASPKRTTGTDGSVRFTLTTTKHLPLRAGGRLVLFVRATLPGKPLIGCAPGRRLISVRVSTPQS